MKQVFLPRCLDPQKASDWAKLRSQLVESKADPIVLPTSLNYQPKLHLFVHGNAAFTDEPEVAEWLRAHDYDVLCFEHVSRIHPECISLIYKETGVQHLCFRVTSHGEGEVHQDLQALNELFPNAVVHLIRSDADSLHHVCKITSCAVLVLAGADVDLSTIVAFADRPVVSIPQKFSSLMRASVLPTGLLLGHITGEQMSFLMFNSVTFRALKTQLDLSLIV